MEHTDKIAVVTGGSGALGSVVTRYLLEAGAKVAIPYATRQPDFRSFGVGEQTTERLLCRASNLTDENQVSAFVTGVVDAWGRVDYLINCAGGYVGGKTIAETSLEEWHSSAAMNLTTAFLMSREALRIMQAQKYGRIVNIASMTSLSPSAGKGAYAVAKRGVVTLTETIAEEYKESGITANAIAPSIIVTPANLSWMKKGDETRWVTPEEIASMVLFLCSDAARSISGNTIKMYGRV